MLGSDDDIAGLYEAFGVEVVFETDSPLAITAIFQEGTEAVFMQGIEIEATKPTLTCRSAQLNADVRKGVTVTVNSVSYTIEKLHRTGTGETCLYLKT